MDGVQRQERQRSAERESRISIQKKTSFSVLENAGISNGQLTNSDRYLAVRLTREFDQVLAQLGIVVDSQINSSQCFDIMVNLMILKSRDKLTTDFAQAENS